MDALSDAVAAAAHGRESLAVHRDKLRAMLQALDVADRVVSAAERHVALAERRVEAAEQLAVARRAAQGLPSGERQPDVDPALRMPVPAATDVAKAAARWIGQAGFSRSPPAPPAGGTLAIDEDPETPTAALRAARAAAIGQS
mmetsp:Transcript_7239/g.18496  ORF Transcript_7239/g.18496 Transcript_7239/m.18496 type:complete len:143 (+) Transcript_7239:558-986(+)